MISLRIMVMNFKNRLDNRCGLSVGSLSNNRPTLNKTNVFSWTNFVKRFTLKNWDFFLVSVDLTNFAKCFRKIRLR
jgi:hypothetical protein